MKINFAIKNHFKIAYFGRKLIKNGLHIYFRIFCEKCEI